MHHHKAAWNALLFGRKLWVLVPPPDASFCRDELAEDSFAAAGKGWLGEAVQRAKGGSSGSDGGGGHNGEAEGGFSSRSGGGGGGGAMPPASTDDSEDGGSTGSVPAQQRRLFCIQREGDVLFVPAGWGHSTLNLQVMVCFIDFTHLLKQP